MSTDQNNRRQVFSAALIVGSLYLVTKVLGLLRESVFAFYFGAADVQAEAYAIVTPMSDLIFGIIAGGALASAFIPVFSGYFANDEHDEAAGWDLFSAILNWVVIIVALVSLVTAIFTPAILNWLFADKIATTPELVDVATPLFRLMLVSNVIFAASGILMATLNARQHFTAPALATVVYNIGIIGGILFYQTDVIGVGVGTVVGALGHLLVQVPMLPKVGTEYRPILKVKDNSVGEVLRLMGPRVLGLSFSFLNPLILSIVAQTMVAGSITNLRYALRLVLAPQGVLGQALGVASFPTFATLAAKNDLPAMRKILSDTLRLILFLGVPISVALVLLGRPLIVLYLERGSFGPDDTTMVTWALTFYAVGLVALVIIEVAVRAFYALKDTWTPVLIGGLQLLLMLMLSLWLGRQLFPAMGLPGVGGVALGFSLANWIEVVLLLWLLSRKMSGIGGRELVNSLSKILAASAGMGVIIWGLAQLLSTSGTQTFLTTLIQLGVPSIIGGIGFLGICILLKIPEADYFLQPILRRFGR